MPKVVIAAGGTAGHVVPALAVAEALRASGAEVEFAGGDRAEAELVPAAGFPFHELKVEGIDRRNPLRAARAVARALRATGRARRMLRATGADAVLGGGGYVAGPVGLAARTLRLPLMLTEADSHLGVTNRLLAPLAQRAFLAFPIPGRDGSKYEVDRAAGPGRHRVGRPRGGAHALRHRRGRGVRAGVRRIAGRPAAQRGRAGGVRRRGPLRRAPRGRDGATTTSSPPRLAALGSPPHYLLHDYIEPFADALAAADLVVARAGGSVLEVAAAGLPSILVPYPHATADHQTANARYMEQAGAAVVVPDGELDGPRLAREVGALLARARSECAAMAKAARAVARPDAAERIAAELLQRGAVRAQSARSVLCSARSALRTRRVARRKAGLVGAARGAGERSVCPVGGEQPGQDTPACPRGLGWRRNACAGGAPRRRVRLRSVPPGGPVPPPWRARRRRRSPAAGGRAGAACRRRARFVHAIPAAGSYPRAPRTARPRAASAHGPGHRCRLPLQATAAAPAVVGAT